MEISTEKSKVLVNSNKDTPQTHITMNGKTLEKVDSFKYLGAIITVDWKSTIEIRASLAIALCLQYQDYQKCGRLKEFQLLQR